MYGPQDCDKRWKIGTRWQHIENRGDDDSDDNVGDDEDSDRNAKCEGVCDV